MPKWLPVIGYEDRYEVSDTGLIRLLHSKNIRRTTMRGGYKAVGLWNGKKERFFQVHRVVAAAFLGEIPEGKQVNHISGVKSDNSALNLEYVTPSENRKHAFRIGLQSNKGEKHSRAKLNNDKVLEIRSLLASGLKQLEVAKMMNVDQSAISRANSGKRWGHLGDELAKNQLVAG